MATWIYALFKIKCRENCISSGLEENTYRVNHIVKKHKNKTEGWVPVWHSYKNPSLYWFCITA